MNAEQTEKGSPQVFKLLPEDVNHVFRRSGYRGTALSPFRYQPEQAAGSRASSLFQALAESPHFQTIARLLLEPDLKLCFQSGGGSAAADRYYALLSTGNAPVLVQMTNTEEELLLLLFSDSGAFLTWWAGMYAASGMAGYQSAFPDTMETEVLVCAFHSIDIYRRSYMESMLDYLGVLNLSLTTQDFVQLLKRSLGSEDKRWLLPTLFELTPDLKNSKLALKPDHLKKLEELGFLTNHESTISLSERAKIMGTEFMTSWMGAFSCQATALIGEEERSLSRVFLAVTAFANHLISFENGAEGTTRFRYQASTASELIKTLVKWVNDLQKAVGGPVGKKETSSPQAKSASAPVQGSEPVRNQFCGVCGTKLQTGKKFCTGCGTPV